MSQLPDILVFVDLGTTFTGVAWMTPRTPIQVINDWPGSGDQCERKVPTVLTYNANGSLSKWGFMCAEPEEHKKTRYQYFKMFVEKDTLESWQRQGLPTARSVAEAEGLVVDYLRKVYEHIKESIETQVGRRNSGGWTDMGVTFLFSVPTTWTKMETINTFKRIIHNAGYGKEGPRHSAEVDLTEAEAAAAATLKTSPNNFQMGSLFLMVDAGGGTTDLAVMQVTSPDSVYPQMSQISQVFGVGIGASLIDGAFIQLVQRRLNAFPEAQQILPPSFAFRLSTSHHFKTAKHKFGERAWMRPEFKMQLEGVPHDLKKKNDAGLRIVDGYMEFSMQDIASLFDAQIEGIMRCIVDQLNKLVEKQQPQQIEYMVLSGGLGASAYVRESLQRRIQSLSHQNARNVSVLPCQEPQLVVVRGMLLDHKQKIETGNISVLASRKARASYGVVIREVYSPPQHFNEDIQADQFDPTKRWAMNQIRWLIRKGDSVNPNAPLVHSLAISLGEGETTRSWDAHIVVKMTGLTLEDVAGAVKLCDVKSNLTGVQQHQLVMKNKRETCFSKGQTWYVMNFDIRVIVAPADLRFELWFGGNKFSGNHEPIAVTWDQDGTKAG
ncbi:hsp70 family chaperone [Colletotrichum sojae]|uniref:Hsp70 family chaperone n=1 Tax=Colletotrichum sojae TaxID=2175907 RepID=A0A8H6IZZ5_9PEZI|nr:hsp70 family chaperone [Colletotrichum sojae]